jgi:ADP-ribose pyrophosphatase YjhB (NUDIX family)
MADASPPSDPSFSAADLLRWGETLAAVARTGLGFSDNLYERERFEEVLRVAAEIRVAAGHELGTEVLADEWMKAIGEGVAGYVTPKVAVGAVVGNDKGEILLIQRADSGVWLYPTGWADIGYSASEIAVKEVSEETGIDVEPHQVIAVLDGLRLGFTRVPLYSVVFHCRAVGGELEPHPLEVRDAGWFSRHDLPEPLAGFPMWGEVAFRAIDGETVDTHFDPPRDEVWRSGEAQRPASGSTTRRRTTKER